MRVVLLTLLALGLLVVVLRFAPGQRDAATSVLPSRESRAEPTPPPRREIAGERLADSAIEPADGNATSASRSDEDSYREPGGDEWHGWTERTPPRVLAGRVLRGVTPVAGARVRMWAAEMGAVSLPVAARETETDSQGRFRFEAVAAGDHHVRADDGDERIQSLVRVDADERGLSVLLLFGRAVVDGLVYDERGGTLAGVPIVVAGIGPLPSRVVHTSTDSRGHFRVGGLVAGRYHVIADRGREFDGADERTVSLEVAGHAQLVFGRTLASVRWTSRLVDARGDSIPGVRSLTFRHVDRGDERRAWTDEQGAFELEIEPGRWIAHLTAGLHAGTRVGAVVLEQRLETGALLHEPARLLVSLREGGHDVADEAVLERARPLLLLRSLNAPSELREPELLGAALHWLAVGAGRYELISRPPLRLAPDDAGRVELTIDEGEATHELALDVTLE